MLANFDTASIALTALALLMTRMIAAFSVIPLFSGNALPPMVRLCFVASLSLCLLPLLGPQATLAHTAWSSLLPCLLKEAGLGLVIGLLCSLAFWALYVAGVIVEFQASMTMSTIIDPLLGREDSLLGGLFLQIFTIIFLISGGLLSLIGLLFESYRLWPIAEMTPLVGNLSIVQLLVGSLMQMIELALKTAAPFVILMLTAELSLGLLARFAPQFNVFFLSLPIKVLILTVLLFLYCLLLVDTPQTVPDFTSMTRSLKGAMP
jgi:type III secretion protein T